VDLSFEIEPSPPSVGPSHLTVILTDDNGVPVDGVRVKVEGYPPPNGMHPLLAQLKVGEDGKYEAPFSWTVGGDWHMVVTASLSDGQALKREFDLTIGEAMDMGDQQHQHEGQNQVKRIPNEGASIRIVSPQDGMVFEKGSDIKVEIGYDNFDLGESGKHWHIYMDGGSPRMIMGKMTEAILRDLEPGQHEISTYLSVGSAHDELEEGATVTITIVDSAAEDTSVKVEDHQE
jgi:hypothetical protein